jgi:hypothetical protein
MNTLREAAQQALEALILADSRDGMYTYAKEIAALRAALAEPEPYDQTALELCEVCGWKTLIPTEGCLNCERQPKAEPQEPVGTYEEVMQTMRSLQTGTLVAQQQMFALLKDKPLYAEPQPRKRLTDEEIDAIYIDHRGDGGPTAMCEQFARAIEAAVWGETK